jgi:hypothetical protein
MVMSILGWKDGHLTEAQRQAHCQGPQRAGSLAAPHGRGLHAGSYRVSGATKPSRYVTYVDFYIDRIRMDIDNSGLPGT